jgi:transposase
VADLFEFPDWATTASVRTRSGQREIVVSALYGLDPDRCPACGDRGPLRAHGSKITAYRDLPADDGKFVRIEVARRRYLCIACGKTSLQPLPEMDGVCRMTHRLVRFVETEVTRQPISGIASAIGVHEKTIRRLVQTYLPDFINRRSRAAEIAGWGGTFMPYDPPTESSTSGSQIYSRTIRHRRKQVR